MSDFQIVRLKGGYRIHRKVAGEWAAICGAQPREVVTVGRRMRRRAGWWRYKDDYEFPHPVGSPFDSRCKVCFKPPE